MKTKYEIILTKRIAMEGASQLAGKEFLRLVERFPRPVVEKAQSFGSALSVEKECEIARNHQAPVFEPGDDGIFAALWRFAELLKTGLSIDIRKIPVHQETIEICEYLGYNPYEIASRGCLLIAAPSSRALLEELSCYGIEAAVIGTTEEGNDRILHNQGRKRYLDRP